MAHRTGPYGVRVKTSNLTGGPRHHPGRARVAPVPPGAAYHSGNDRTAQLRCTRCRKTPKTLLWSDAEGRFLHGRVMRAPRDDTPVICGGHVIVAGREGSTVLAPGALVPAYPVRPTMTAHLVRLGRLAHRRNASWTGTALCGYSAERDDHWIPALPDSGSPVELCETCRASRRAPAARVLMQRAA